MNQGDTTRQESSGSAMALLKNLRTIIGRAGLNVHPGHDWLTPQLEALWAVTQNRTRWMQLHEHFEKLGANFEGIVGLSKNADCYALFVADSAPIGREIVVPSLCFEEAAHFPPPFEPTFTVKLKTGAKVEGLPTDLRFSQPDGQPPSPAYLVLAKGKRTGVRHNSMEASAAACQRVYSGKVLFPCESTSENGAYAFLKHHGLAFKKTYAAPRPLIVLPKKKVALDVNNAPDMPSVEMDGWIRKKGYRLFSYNAEDDDEEGEEWGRVLYYLTDHLRLPV